MTERLKNIARKIMKVIGSFPQDDEWHRVKIRYSRQHMSMMYRNTESCFDFSITNSMGNHLNYDGRTDKFHHGTDELTWIFLLFEDKTEEEIECMLKSKEIRFVAKDIKPFAKKEKPNRDRMMYRLYALRWLLKECEHQTLYVSFKEKDDNPFMFHVPSDKSIIWKMGYKWRERYIWDYDRHLNHFLLEEMLNALNRIPNSVIAEHASAKRVLILQKPNAPLSTSEKMAKWIEKRNDLKLLHRMFGDEKYNRNVKRINYILKKHSVTSQ